MSEAAPKPDVVLDGYAEWVEGALRQQLGETDFEWPRRAA